MKISRPSPALVVSIIALIVACAGTATAASVLIKNSSQIAKNAVTSSDIKNGGVTGVDIASNAIGDRQVKDNSIGTDKLKASVRNTLRGQGFTAIEAVRRAGPDNQAAGGLKTIATMQQLAPGTYAIFAKTTVSPQTTSQGLLGEVLQQRQGSAHCILDAAGDIDDAREQISAPGEAYPKTLNMQVTRTFEQPADIKLTCEAGTLWKATDTSIIALKLQGSSRVDTTS